MFEKAKRETTFGKKFLLLLLISCPIVVFSIIFSPVLASLSPVPSIEIDNVQGVLYEVNDDGETTIRVTGAMIGVSIATCNFQLEIPSSFEMDTLADGSPIMEMIANGSSVEKTQDDNEFGAVFVLKTYNSTLIPKSYLLEINSTNLQYSSINYIGFITPQWPQQEPNNLEGGGGAGITSLYPYITDFKAYNSDKGQNEHVKTWIENPTPYPVYLERLRYQIKADDYNWEDWTPWYSENAYIWDGYTRIVHDYLDNIFTSPFTPNKKYALNIGDLEPGTISKDYKVTSVRAEGTGFASTYSPGWKGKFNVNPPASGTHVVFVAHLVDQSFRDAKDENSYFDNLENNVEFAIAGEGDHTLKDDFDIDFSSLVLSWTPDEEYDIDDLYDDMIIDAKNALGLSADWSDTQGTNSNNHGFDLLFAHSWEMNTDGPGNGLAIRPGNRAVVMKGWWIGGPGGPPEYGDCDLTTLHETLHTFGCYPGSGGHCPVSGYIMHYNDAGYDMHSNTEDTLLENINQYDGL